MNIFFLGALAGYILTGWSIYRYGPLPAALRSQVASWSHFWRRKLQVARLVAGLVILTLLVLTALSANFGWPYTEPSRLIAWLTDPHIVSIPLGLLFGFSIRILVERYTALTIGIAEEDKRGSEDAGQDVPSSHETRPHAATTPLSNQQKEQDELRPTASPDNHTIKTHVSISDIPNESVREQKHGSIETFRRLFHTNTALVLFPLIILTVLAAIFFLPNLVKRLDTVETPWLTLRMADYKASSDIRTIDLKRQLQRTRSVQYIATLPRIIESDTEWLTLINRPMVGDTNGEIAGDSEFAEKRIANQAIAKDFIESTVVSVSDGMSVLVKETVAKSDQIKPVVLGYFRALFQLVRASQKIIGEEITENKDSFELLGAYVHYCTTWHTALGSLEETLEAETAPVFANNERAEAETPGSETQQEGQGEYFRLCKDPVESGKPEELLCLYKVELQNVTTTLNETPYGLIALSTFALWLGEERNTIELLDNPKIREASPWLFQDLNLVRHLANLWYFGYYERSPARAVALYDEVIETTENNLQTLSEMSWNQRSAWRKTVDELTGRYEFAVAFLRTERASMLATNFNELNHSVAVNESDLIEAMQDARDYFNRYGSESWSTKVRVAYMNLGITKLAVALTKSEHAFTRLYLAEARRLFEHVRSQDQHTGHWDGEREALAYLKTTNRLLKLHQGG